MSKQLLTLTLLSIFLLGSYRTGQLSAEEGFFEYLGRSVEEMLHVFEDEEEEGGPVQRTGKLTDDAIDVTVDTAKEAVEKVTPAEDESEEN